MEYIGQVWFWGYLGSGVHMKLMFVHSPDQSLNQHPTSTITVTMSAPMVFCPQSVLVNFVVGL